MGLIPIMCVIGIAAAVRLRLRAAQKGLDKGARLIYTNGSAGRPDSPGRREGDTDR